MSVAGAQRKAHEGSQRPLDAITDKQSLHESPRRSVFSFISKSANRPVPKAQIGSSVLAANS